MSRLKLKQPSIQLAPVFVKRIKPIKKTPQLAGCVTVLLLSVIVLGFKFGLAHALPGLYTVSGQVTINSTPVPNFSLGYNGGIGGTTTDSNGNYSLSDIQNGNYNFDAGGGSFNSGGNSAATGVPDYIHLTSGPALTVNGSNVTQNYAFSSNTLTITVDDANGNPVVGAAVYAYANGTFTDDNGNAYNGDIQSNSTTGSTGTAAVALLPGMTYTVCTQPSGTESTFCNTETVSANVSDTIIVGAPQAPTNLSAPSPTNLSPSLSWTASSGATSYNIYRNGTIIGTSTTTTYTDSSAPQGSNSYYVTAVNSASESAASNTTTVVYDTTPPSITYTVAPPSNSNGWNNSQVTVTFICSASVGIFSCPSPQTLISEGANQTVTGTTTDNAGNSASVTTAPISIDETIPTVGTPTLLSSTITQGQSTTLTASASDNLSGVTNGEYYIGSTDPGQGNGTPMTYNSSTGNLTTTVGSTLTPGTYTFNVRSEDAAGNWSTVSRVSLQVNPVIPAAPTNLTANSPTTTAPILSWTASSGATSYNIYRNGTKVGSTTTATTYTDSTASQGSYSYYVTAVNAGGESSASNTISVVYNSIPAAPTNLTAPSPTTTAPVLSWTGVSGATYYNIYRNDTKLDTISASNTTYTDNTALVAGTESYYVTAVNTGGESSSSNTISVTITDPAAVVGAITAPATVAKSASFTASAAYTYARPTDTHTATWNWGDNSTSNGTIAESNGSGSVSNTHTYTSPGSYTITLSVTNENGNSATSQFVIAVSPKTTNTFKGANLSGYNYSSANLSSLDLSGSNLQNGTFTGTNFTSSNLSGDNAPNANFQNANFTSADLAGSTFQSANFSSANFTGANLKGANFKSATVANATWSNTTCPDGTNSNSDGNTCVGHGGGL